MTLEEREFLGRHWTENGRAEHASVASFARFAMQLMSTGAPPEMLTATANAMRDEVRHAQLCFGVAGRLLGRPVGPGRFPLTPDVIGDTSLDAILASVLIEGCLNETIAVAYAQAALDRAEDAGIREVLTEIVADEQRHADLAWAFVEWLLARHPEYAPLAAGILRAGIEREDEAETPDSAPAIASGYGYVGDRAKREARRRVVAGIIEPRAQEILRTLEVVGAY